MPPDVESRHHEHLADAHALRRFVLAHRRVFVLTGAGCSTESGIPDYRDAEGRPRGRGPMRFQEFRDDAAARRRYWARGFLGWPAFAAARPNPAHHALAWLESLGFVHHVVTQNVDRLHQRAGSRSVTDLHGRLDRVVCLGCGVRMPRAVMQRLLATCNPGWSARVHAVTPDGDVDIDARATEAFDVPACSHCGGILKPDVVFFGERLPEGRAQAAMAPLEEADALLVVGSSLAVGSGFRFVLQARRRGLPMALVNLGRTRADAWMSVLVRARCGQVLPALLGGAA